MSCCCTRLLPLVSPQDHKFSSPTCGITPPVFELMTQFWCHATRLTLLPLSLSSYPRFVDGGSVVVDLSPGRSGTFLDNPRTPNYPQLLLVGTGEMPPDGKFPKKRSGPSTCTRNHLDQTNDRWFQDGSANRKDVFLRTNV